MAAARLPAPRWRRCRRASPSALACARRRAASRCWKCRATRRRRISASAPTTSCARSTASGSTRRRSCATWRCPIRAGGGSPSSATDASRTRSCGIDAAMGDLFQPDPTPAEQPGRPLADRLRPTTLAQVVGQEHLTGDDGVLTRMIRSGSLGSMIFWGPPGTGKTTVARLLAGETGLAFEQISAIFSGVADLKKVFETARMRRANGRQTLLFVDEIHRFNRAQQDSFLPVMEDGTVILVGATTENPSFELNAALLSRARVLIFHPLEADSLERL